MSTVASIPPTCPLPAVESALVPYIRTRAETLRIRRALTTHLLSLVNLPDSNGPITNLTLLRPPHELRLRAGIPPEVTGVRREFLETLEKRNAALARREGLRAEIEELREKYKGEREAGERREELNGRVEGYTALLRARQRHAKVKVVEKGVNELVDARPELLDTNLATLVQEKIGVSPDPTSATLDSERRDPAVEELRFRLKREVLLARQGADKARARRVKAQDEARKRGSVSLEEQVEALTKAKDELVGWIEGELGKIGEESEMLGESPRKLATKEENFNLEELCEKVKLQYEGYLERRQEFVTAVDQLSSVAEKTRHTRKEVAKSSNAKPQLSLAQSQHAPTVSELVHVVKPLLQISRTETDLHQQLTYMRRQLTSASEDTFSTLRRLADESHLVPPRSDNVEAWVQAAKESSKETRQEVEKNLGDGERSIKGAKEILDKLRAQQQAFDSIKGTL